MKQTNKKPNKDIWKVILIVWDVIVLIFLVWFSFMYSLEILSEDLPVEPAVQEDTIDYMKFRVEIPQLTIFYESEESLEEIETLDNSSEQTFEEIVSSYVFDICQSYPNVNPYIVLSMIFQESRFIPNVSSGNCVGLMQVSTYWQRDRAVRLGVTDFFDPYSNILVGTDLLSELIDLANGNIYYALTMYNQGITSNGTINSYAKEVVERASHYEEVDSYGAWSSSC